MTICRLLALSLELALSFATAMAFAGEPASITARGEAATSATAESPRLASPVQSRGNAIWIEGWDDRRAGDTSAPLVLGATDFDKETSIIRGGEVIVMSSSTVQSRPFRLPTAGARAARLTGRSEAIGDVWPRIEVALEVDSSLAGQQAANDRSSSAVGTTCSVIVMNGFVASRSLQAWDFPLPAAIKPGQSAKLGIRVLNPSPPGSPEGRRFFFKRLEFH